MSKDLTALIRTRNALRILLKNGWRSPATHQIGAHGLYFVRRLRNGRMVGLCLSHDGRLSVMGN